MWEKIVSIVLKIWFAITPQDKSEYTNFQILSKDEFYEKQDEFILREVIYEDKIESFKKTMRGAPVTSQHVVRTPLFVCQKRESHYIRELKTKAYIGVKNYPVFEKLQSDYDNLVNDFNSSKNQIVLQNKELQDKIKRLKFIERELGSNVFKNYINKYEQLSEKTRQ